MTTTTNIDDLLGAATYGRISSAAPIPADLLGAATYGRISDDPGHDRSGVLRQVEDGNKRVDAEPGWRNAGTFVDNDMSATRGKRRPEFAALMDAVRRGEVRVIVCYMTSRLVRNPRERAETYELFAERGVKVVCTHGVSLDFSTPAGRMLALILAAVDWHEVEQMAARIARQKRQAAEKGLPVGSLLYGYKPNPSALKNAKERVIVPEQAEVIRFIRDRILAGDSLRTVAIVLDEKGVPAPKGGPWHRSSLRGLMLNPALAGRMFYKGEDLGKASWPEIISYDDHLKLRNILSPRRTPDGWSPKIKHLLSGIVICGKCSTGKCDCKGNVDGKGHRVPMVGHGGYVVNGQTFPRHYRCKDKPAGCNGLRRAADGVEDYAVNTVLAMLADPTVARAVLVSGAPDVEASLELQSKIDGCTNRAVNIGLRLAETDPANEMALLAFQTALTSLKSELDDLLRQQATMSRSSVIGRIPDINHLVEHWRAGDLTLMEKRAIIASAVVVTIMPSGYGRKAGTEHVLIDWKV